MSLERSVFPVVGEATGGTQNLEDLTDYEIVTGVANDLTLRIFGDAAPASFFSTTNQASNPLYRAQARPA